MSIRVVVDSSADLPKHFIDKYNVKLVPLSIKFGEEEYYDKVNLSPSEFYQKLRESDELPITGQVTPIQFKEVFEEILADGDEILFISIASNASGTMQSANIAKNELETDKITIVDSNSLFFGHSYITILACRMVEQGYTREEIADRLKKYTANKIEHLFTVDDMQALVRGGRIKAYKAFLANVLNIKPVLSVHDGITYPIGKVRSRKRIIPYYIDKVKREMDAETDFILVGHSCDLDFAEAFVKRFKEETDYDLDIYIGEIGATIGTHCGEGVLSIFYIKKDEFVKKELKE